MFNDDIKSITCGFNDVIKSPSLQACVSFYSYMHVKIHSTTYEKILIWGVNDVIKSPSLGPKLGFFLRARRAVTLGVTSAS